MLNWFICCPIAVLETNLEKGGGALVGTVDATVEDPLKQMN